MAKLSYELRSVRPFIASLFFLCVSHVGQQHQLTDMVHGVLEKGWFIRSPLTP